MNASEIKFGIECETHISQNDPTLVGSYYHPRQVSWLPAGWNVGRDGSIEAPMGRHDAEFASPILMGEEGIKQAHESIKKIAEHGRVNASCGVHVTVTFPRDNGPALARLISLFAHFETAIYATTGTTRRENSYYAKGITRYAQGAGSTKQKVKKTRDGLKGASVSKYHGMNLAHLENGHDRIEFRLFSGSTNADKIIAWVRLILGIVEYAINTDRMIAFDNHNSIKRFGGDGQRDLVYLLSRLGWLPWKSWGYKGKVYGDVSPEGLPSLTESAKTLRKMAKKYDAQKQEEAEAAASFHAS